MIILKYRELQDVKANYLRLLSLNSNSLLSVKANKLSEWCLKPAGGGAGPAQRLYLLGCMFGSGFSNLICSLRPLLRLIPF